MTPLPGIERNGRGRSFNDICAKVVINEIVPRCDRFGVSLQQTSTELVRLLCYLEFRERTDRRFTRTVLDDHFSCIARSSGP